MKNLNMLTLANLQVNSRASAHSDALRAEDPPSLKSSYGGAGGSRSGGVVSRCASCRSPQAFGLDIEH